MNMLGRVFALPDFLRALKAGEELVNAAKVKNIQGVSSALAALLIACAVIARDYGYVLPITDAQLGELAVIGTTLVFNAWATFATSARVGLPSSGGATPAGGTDGTGYGGNAQQPDQLDGGSTDLDLPVLTEREALNWQNPKG